MRQKLVPPLLVQGLADLMLSANRGHRFAFEALDHNHSFGVGVSLSSFHG
jgi:hypothetical protein